MLFEFANTRIYAEVLKSMGLRLEDLLKSFYEKHFNEAFGYKGFPLTMPSEDVDWIAKCRTILPEFDSIAKQYNLYVEYDEINPQILRLSVNVLFSALTRTSISSTFVASNLKFQDHAKERSELSGGVRPLPTLQ